jgi:hypothetical protein
MPLGDDSFGFLPLLCLYILEQRSWAPETCDICSWLRT